MLAIAKHSETGEEMVVYRALYGEKEVWIRPKRMWEESVTYQGKTLSRFTYIP